MPLPACLPLRAAETEALQQRIDEVAAKKLGVEAELKTVAGGQGSCLLCCLSVGRWQLVALTTLPPCGAVPCIQPEQPPSPACLPALLQGPGMRCSRRWRQRRLPWPSWKVDGHPCNPTRGPRYSRGPALLPSPAEPRCVPRPTRSLPACLPRCRRAACRQRGARLCAAAGGAGRGAVPAAGGAGGRAAAGGAAKQADLQGARGQLEATAADLAAEREAVAALAGGGQAATCWGDALGVAVGCSLQPPAGCFINGTCHCPTAVGFIPASCPSPQPTWLLPRSRLRSWASSSPACPTPRAGWRRRAPAWRPSWRRCRLSWLRCGGDREAGCCGV